ncbi:unnamed protein product [Parascedosporium putredinis]|uniref:Uncharacterized protein n=1 Tax=Parascedosporium putredinis TaxID=1442378 RepID=A0A9P1HEE1_9PEZI|nr:unnamed protein product [Parascedosporium putredinis]CAI8005134.1 unnamed protein product [Parascedosporium putredinis]
MASIPAEEHASSLSNDALLGGHSRNNSHGPGIHKRTGSVFTYPPHYGSYLQPLLPELWKQAMDSMMAQGLANTDHMPSPNFNYMAAAGPSTPRSEPLISALAAMAASASAALLTRTTMRRKTMSSLPGT